MRAKNTLVFGHGINDAGYSVTRYKVIDGKNRQVWMCPIYRTWRDMLGRCYSNAYQRKKPTYIGCSVTASWLVFSNFSRWMLLQEWQGMALDKDIIFKSNKVYAPDNCTFVTQALNSFLNDYVNGLGNFPIGAAWVTSKRKFQCQCHNPFLGIREKLGDFNSPDDAHEAWRKRKHQHALRYADLQTDPRLAQALRIRYLADKESI